MGPPRLFTLTYSVTDLGRASFPAHSHSAPRRILVVGRASAGIVLDLLGSPSNQQFAIDHHTTRLPSFTDIVAAHIATIGILAVARGSCGSDRWADH